MATRRTAASIAAALAAGSIAGSTVTSTRQPITAASYLCDFRALPRVRPDGGSELVYTTRRVRTAKVKATGEMLVPNGEPGDVVGKCTEVSGTNAEPIGAYVETPGACACKPKVAGAQLCEELRGGAPGEAESWKPARARLTIPAGRWRGSCAPRSCGVLDGDQAYWPKECE